MQTKKVVSVLLAGVTTLSMAMPVLAANGDPNLVVTPDTQYSTPITSGSSVTLGLMPANAYYQRTGFDSADDAAEGLEVKSINVGSDKINTKNFEYGSMKLADGSFAGTVTVTGVEGKYGPASLHIVNTFNEDASIDMTVYVEADKTQDAVDGVTVQAVDVRNGVSEKAVGTNLSVAAATEKTSNPFNGADGSAQTYPTVGDSLYSLAEAKGLTFTQNDGYVQSVTTSDNKTLAAYSDSDWNYYGWNYCVVRDGAKVTEGDVVSASVLEVEKGDSVYWAFGTMAQANEYFATRVANN